MGVDYSAAIFYGIEFKFDRQSVNYDPNKDISDFTNKFFFNNYVENLDILNEDSLGGMGTHYLCIHDSIQMTDLGYSLIINPYTFTQSKNWHGLIYEFCIENGLMYDSPNWQLIVMVS